MDTNTKNLFSKNTPLDTVLWYFEELYTEKIFEILEKKMETETLGIPYGKLLERLLLIKNYDKGTCIYEKLISYAEEKLTQYKLNLDSPIAVLGDASSSMGIAIKTSCIFMSVLCAMCDAEMVLFRGHNEKIDNPPKSVKDVMQLSATLNAGGCTSPAASLYEYYKNEKKIKTFIIVTDEEENTMCFNYKFATLFKAYREKICHAKIVFISFLQNNKHGKDGQMVSELKAVIPDIEADLMQFKLDKYRPDLSKMDHILNTLMINSVDYSKNIDKIYTPQKTESKDKNIVVSI